MDKNKFSTNQNCKIIVLLGTHTHILIFYIFLWWLVFFLAEGLQFVV